MTEAAAIPAVATPLAAAPPCAMDASVPAAPALPAELPFLTPSFLTPPFLTPPFLAVVIPVLYEEGYIEPCLRSLLPQLPPGRHEVLVMDGGSTDRTPAIVAALAREHPALRLVPNPRRIQSAACNLAARIADPRATVLLRADAHADYPPGFVASCLAALEQSGATSVVVPMRTVGVLPFQRAVAAAQNSRLGNGGSAHRGRGRSGPRSGPVEHGHHAAFRRDFFLRLGGYDERFTHNEDAEHDLRALAAGGRVWMCGDAPVTYFPRTTPQALWRQYLRHGAGRARTLLTHRRIPRPRQAVPLAVLAGTVGGLALSPLVPGLLALPVSYALLCLGWGVAASVRARDPALLGMALAAAIMHHAWAVGFLREGAAHLRRAAPLPVPSPA